MLGIRIGHQTRGQAEPAIAPSLRGVRVNGLPASCGGLATPDNLAREGTAVALADQHQSPPQKLTANNRGRAPGGFEG